MHAENSSPVGGSCIERFTQPSLANWLNILPWFFPIYKWRGESLGFLKPVVIKARAIQGGKNENKTADTSIYKVWEGLGALCTIVKCLPGLEWRSTTWSHGYMTAFGSESFFQCEQSQVERKISGSASTREQAGRIQQAVQDNVFLNLDRSDRTGDPHVKYSSKKHFRAWSGGQVWKELTTQPVKLWDILPGNKAEV